MKKTYKCKCGHIRSFHPKDGKCFGQTGKCPCRKFEEIKNDKN